jgi:hypothetical protein
MIQGTVTVKIPDAIEIPEKAGKLSPEELRRLPKPRRGLGVACENTSDAMLKNPTRIVPHDVDALRLAIMGQMAEQIDQVIVDTEAILVKMKQANTLLDVAAHEGLRKVLAFVRSQEKFDPRITDLVPHLITYFANTQPPKAGDGNTEAK